jgi:hypothetical protein
VADGPALALQKGLIQQIKALSSVTSLVGQRIYDEPPQGVELPYVRIGNIDLRPFRTDARVAWSFTFSIEVYSRPTAGRVEATRIAEAVIAGLDEQHRNLTVAGFTPAWVQFITSTVSRADEGKSYVAIIAFDAVLDA